MQRHTHNGKVIVALSGGVDSAVAALRLCNAGREVEALHMTNWEDDDGYCTAAQDLQDARLVANELGIPLHVANFSAAYRQRVFAGFLADYQAGFTPNPDVLCNREIKFGVFLDHALRLGASRIATGHYARLASTPPTRLLRGRDASKDQSYFLHAVGHHALSQAEFPLGELHKTEVRRLATEAGLPVHRKRDSTGICFVGERPFRDFLGRYLKGAPGAIETPAGVVLGEHEGLMFYTLGQRQGLRLGGQRGYPDAPWYVAAKRSDDNVLVAVQDREHPLLWSDQLVAGDPHWVAQEPSGLASGRTLLCTAKTRYRQPDADCRVSALPDGRLRVDFVSSQWAVTPGQYVVFYSGDECLGGARIQQVHALRETPRAAAASA